MSETDPFPAGPQLRLDPEGHTAMINRIDCDAGGRWLVSGSDDKTVKVWRIADGGLERTLRVPLGPGDLGKVYAVAISPDGGLVAAGGWTGYADLGGHRIYIFDRATGLLRRTLGGLPNVIHHLTWSPDGTRLAATLGGPNGLRLYDTDGWTELGRDTDYGDRSHWAAFAADGRLVTSCWDGKVRLYRADSKGSGMHPTRTHKAPGGTRPFGVAFSPDGSRIAVAYDDSTRVDLLDGATLEPIGTADTTGVGNGSLSTVAWSADGERLLAGGRGFNAGKKLVRQWGHAGTESDNALVVSATNTIMSLCPLADGRLAVGAADRIVLLDADDRETWSRPVAAADLRGQKHDNGIRLSADADRVAFGFEQRAKRPALFSLPDLALTADPPGSGLADLTLPDEGPRHGLAVTDWKDQYQPKLNGRPLALEPYELSRSLAIQPDGQGLMLGTEWWLRSFDTTGNERWRQPVLGTARAVNCSTDGRWVVAGYDDGTLRWHRADSGEEVLALYPHPDGRRWVLWTPLGHYTASSGGEDLIAWHLNHGPDQTPEVFGASRFRERFHRPDVIARVLTTGDPAEALRLADAARPGNLSGPTTGAETARAIAEALPPTVRLLSPAPGSAVDSQRLVLLYDARSSTGPIERIIARLDGRPAELIEEVVASRSDDGGHWVGQVSLRIPAEDGTAELIAVNRHGSSEPAAFRIQWGGGSDAYKPRLFCLAVGVAAYPAESLRLRFSADDARAVAEQIEHQRGGLYREVLVRLLPDAEATKPAVIDGLQWLRRQVGQRDVALVFLAGHGVRDEYDDYFFLTHDGDPLDPLGSALASDEIRKFLRTIAGKTVLFIDTCYSGALRAGRGTPDSLPDIDRLANELADADSGVVVFSSSTGKELSLEHADWGHGAFTSALLEAVRDGRADYTQSGHVTIDELALYIDQCVRRLTDGRQHPTMTKPKAVPNYPMFRIAAGSG